METRKRVLGEERPDTLSSMAKAGSRFTIWVCTVSGTNIRSGSPLHEIFTSNIEELASDEVELLGGTTPI